MEGLCKCPHILPHHLQIRPHYSEHTTAAELTRPPVQDLEPRSTVGQEHPVPPRAEAETPVSLPTTTCHLGAPVVQEPQRVSV